MFGVKLGRKTVYGQRAVPAQSSLLVARGYKFVNWYPYRHAASAGRAVWYIEMFAAAAETAIRQCRVQARIFGKMRVGEQCHGFQSGQIIATMWRRCVKPQFLYPGHARIPVAGQS